MSDAFEPISDRPDAPLSFVTFGRLNFPFVLFLQKEYRLASVKNAPRERVV